MIKAKPSDKALIISILTKAFDNNHSVNYVAKQDSKRIKRIEALMNYSYEVCNLFGEIYLSENKQACALLLFPNKQRTTLKTIWLDIQLMFNCIGLSRVNKVLKRNARIKSAYPKTETSYLWFIGVLSSEQGKGMGSQLLKDIMQLAQYQNTCLLLETSMPQNLPFYEKLGFHTYKELLFDHKLYMMKRELK